MVGLLGYCWLCNYLKGDIFRTWETAADDGIWSGGNDQPDRLIVRERERGKTNKWKKKRNKKETRRMKGEDDDDDKEKGKECTTAHR